MFLGSLTLGMHIRFEDTPCDPRVANPRPTFGLYLSRTLRGPCTLGMRPQFEASPHASRVAYPLIARSI